MRERARADHPTSGARFPGWTRGAGAAARVFGLLLHRGGLAALAALVAFAGAAPVRAAPAPGTSILNTASGAGVFVTGNEPFTRTSNTVRAIVQPLAVPPALAFYNGPAFDTETAFGAAGDPLWLQATAPQCDVRPAERDTITLTVGSLREGDQETVRAIETAPSSGVFRVLPALATANGGLGTANAGDQVLSLARGDEVTAVLLGCGAPRTEAVLWIEPMGVVFAARDGAPVPGARITLVDVTGEGNGGAPGMPAHVFAPGDLAPLPNPVTSDLAGRFAFPLVAASTYRLVIEPPASYRFPSHVPPSQLPVGLLVDPAGSYGAEFTTAKALAPVVLDVPLDFAPGDVLFVETQALRPIAEVGDAVDFAVRVANRSAAAIDSIVVVDQLPWGFAFEPGTLRLAADPAAIAARPLVVLPGGGRTQSFAIGTLAAGETIELRFRTRVGAGAEDGGLLNVARAIAPTATSNTATAAVELVSGPFSPEATVVGAVFVDADGDGRPGPGDPALPGVRLWLDDGTFVVTDADGRYSLDGIAPRVRALKLDPTTLPAGARPVALDPRDAGAPGLRFVDLVLGDLVRVDFAVTGDTALVAAARARTVALAASGRGEIARVVERGSEGLAPVRPTPDPRSLPSSEITTGEARLPLFQGAPASLAAARRADEGGASLEDLLPALDARLGFVDFASHDTVGMSPVVVRVKGALGTAFTLAVDGVEIPASRVGRKVSLPGTGVEAWEYVGVRLKPGPNVLTLDNGATAGAPVTVTVVAPDAPSRLLLVAPSAAPADGWSQVPLELRLVDAAGIPVGARTIVTVEATLGRIVAGDLDASAVGTQVAIEGGVATLALVGQGHPGVAHVVAKTPSGITAEARIAFVPDLRAPLLVGAVEGFVALHGTPGGDVPEGVEPKPLFDAPPAAFVSRSKDGTQEAALRGSLFYKGRIQDDVLLTLGYDSERAPHVRAFRDLQPDAFYPLYGDGAVRGFEAQSTRPFYARVDRHGASLLYGDFITPGAGGARTLSAYSRTLNGVVGSYEDPRFKVAGWSSRERSRRQVDELRGRGVSGPYALTVVPFVDGTERVEVIVKDRERPSVVLRSSPRQRFVDYAIDARTGELVMKAPVPSVDSELNPVFVRVTYEVEDGGEPFWTTGFEARVRPVAKLEVGGSYVDDHDPAGPNQVRSVFAAAQTGARSVVEAELATTRSAESGERDLGGRLEWRHAATGIEARAWGAATGQDFANPTSGYGPGRMEGGGRVSAVLSPRTRLLGEALYTGTTTGGARHGGVLLALDRGFGQTMRGELGTRFVAGVAEDGTTEPFAATVRGKLSARFPHLRELDTHLELEQDTHVSDRRRAAIGAEMRVLPRLRAYGRHEFLGGRLTPWELSGARQNHSTVFGLDANVTPEARLFSEYRMDGALGPRSAEAVLGLRNAWHLRSGARITGSLERIQPVGADDPSLTATGASFAAAVGVDYAASPWWKGSARTEFRTSRASEAILATVAGGLRIDRTWSALLRNHFSLVHGDQGQRADRERLQVGFAYRPGDGWDALGRYELRWDHDGGGPEIAPGVPAAVLDRTAHVVSLHGAGPLGGRTRGGVAAAAKWVDDDTDGLATATSAQWLHGRVAWTLGRRYDAGFLASVREASGSSKGGFGAELGRRLDENVWLTLGYNRWGYADDELTGEEFTRQGVYFKVRAKFDESLFVGSGSAPAPPSGPQGGRP